MSAHTHHDKQGHDHDYSNPEPHGHSHSGDACCSSSAAPVDQTGAPIGKPVVGTDGIQTPIRILQSGLPYRRRPAAQKTGRDGGRNSAGIQPDAARADRDPHTAGHGADSGRRAFAGLHAPDCGWRIGPRRPCTRTGQTLVAPSAGDPTRCATPVPSTSTT